MSLLETTNQTTIINRINKLKPTNTAAWGRMNVNQMICHVADQLRVSLGDLG